MDKKDIFDICWSLLPSYYIEQLTHPLPSGPFLLGKGHMLLLIRQFRFDSSLARRIYSIPLGEIHLNKSSLSIFLTIYNLKLMI